MIDSAPASSPRTPDETLRQLLTDVSADAWNQLHLLYHPDTHVEHPFADDASRHLHGREALREHFSRFAATGMRLSARDLLMHHTSDPELVVAEFAYDVCRPDDPRPLVMAACFVWRVRDGLVVHSRDYLDQPKPA